MKFPRTTRWSRRFAAFPGLRLLLSLALPLVALVAACGGASESLQKQIDELRSEVVRTRAENAVLAERLDGLDRAARAATSGRGPAGTTPRPAGGDRPDLEVVRLVPEGAAPAADPGGDADEARTRIRSTQGGALVEEPVDGASAGAPKRRLVAQATPGGAPKKADTKKD